MSNASARTVSTWDGALVRGALAGAVRKLDPRLMWKNPVMFVVEVGSVLTSGIWLRDVLASAPEVPAWFTGNLALWLWFTVLFANFAEALAEGRGKAQAAALRGLRKETIARADGRRQRGARARLGPAQGRPGGGRGGRGDPGRRRGRSKASHRWTNRPSPANRRR